MGIHESLHKYDKDEIKECADEKGLYPGIVKGTEDGIQFGKSKKSRVNRTDWETFFEIMDRKNLAVYGTEEGWMKILEDKDK